jgi:hypothetical protein
MAPRMSRRDRLVLRLIMGVAFATFLLAIWAFIDFGRSRSATVSPATGTTNGLPAASR